MGNPELSAWCLLLCFVAFWGKIIATSDDPDPLQASAIATSVIDAGAFTVAAWIMILLRAGSVVPERPASTRLVVAALGIGVLCIIPLRPVSVAVLAVLGGTLLLAPQATRSGRQVGLLLASLAVVSASYGLVPVHVRVAVLDARIVAWLARVVGMDAVADGNVVTHGDFGLEILVQCTSSVQLAQVLLAFCVIVVYRRGECRRSDLPWLLSALCASVLLTEIRLLLMLRSEADYHWWHYGPGATVYLLAALASAALFPLLATAVAPARADQPA
jgi:hypothetical protein